MTEKNAPEYKIEDLVSIKRTEFVTGLKLTVKFFDPY